MNVEEINAIYQASCDKIIPYIRLEDSNQGDPNSEEGKASLIEGIKGFETVISFSPANWSAHWMIGKAQQALQQHESAYNAFLKAYRNSLTDENVMRELAIECLQTKRFQQAVHYCYVAMEFALEDYTLWPNMAVAQMFNGNLEESESWAKKSLVRLPGDVVATNVLRIIAEIRDGKRPQPNDFSALEQQ